MFFCADLRIFDVSLPLHWWFDDFSMRHWWSMEISMQTILISKDFIVYKILIQTLLINIAFFVLTSKTLMNHCCVIDGSLEEPWWNSDDFGLKITEHWCFVLNVLICETLIFACCSSDVLLMLLWGNLDETAMIWMQVIMIIYVFFASLCITDVSLLLHWCFFDEVLKNKGDFDANIIDQKQNIVLVFQTLMFHCCFLDFLLVSLRRNFDETLMFSIQTPMIGSFFKELISEIFMFHYCVSDDSLMILRRGIVETARIWMRNLMIINSSFC